MAARQPFDTDTTAAAAPPLLEVKDLRIHFNLDDGVLKAVSGVNFTIPQGKVVGLIGESGCGKSITAHSLMKLLPKAARIVEGEIRYHRTGNEVVDIAKLDPSGAEIRQLRGKEISMIFQEPMTSLSPVHSIGNQLMESILLHTTPNKAEAFALAVEMLRRVHISNPEQRMREYPHQLSGGMRQRVMIANALACSPRLLIADEPTTALDVTVQAQILELIAELQSQFQMSVLYITHNLGVVAEVCDEVLVMYLGKIVEAGDVRSIFRNPMHPYTQRLLDSTPRIGRGDRRLSTIEGSVPIPINLPVQCGFYTRCPVAKVGVCNTASPALVEVEPRHAVRCFLHSPEKEVAP